MRRPQCPVCNQRPRAINYYRDGIAHYRSRCEYCQKRDRRKKPPDPRWQSRGYKKKLVCDMCGFKARFTSQILVYHMDGNLNNCEIRNLRSICRNCMEVIMHTDSPWKRGDLEPDV